jgi:hypothetical protein
MKTLALLLALCAPLAADVVGPTAMQAYDQQMPWAPAGSVAYALNKVSPTVQSSAIDALGYTTIFMTVTTSAGTTGTVDILQSNATGQPAWKTVTYTAPGQYAVPVRGRYVTVRSAPANVTYSTMSAFYYLGGPSSAAITLATPTPGVQPVSPTAQKYARYEASASYTTHTTTTINMTSTAGANVPLNATFRAVRGGTSLIYAINASLTPQSTVASLEGREVITAASHKEEGPCYTPGQFIHIRASGTASVTGTLILEECR